MRRRAGHDAERLTQLVAAAALRIGQSHSAKSQKPRNRGLTPASSDKLWAMTDEKRQAIKLAIKRQTEADTASPAAARAALVRMGIYTADGKIAPDYDHDPRLRDTRPRT
jgi:hypothetical protein